MPLISKTVSFTTQGRKEWALTTVAAAVAAPLMSPGTHQSCVGNFLLKPLQLSPEGFFWLETNLAACREQSGNAGDSEPGCSPPTVANRRESVDEHFQSQPIKRYNSEA